MSSDTLTSAGINNTEELSRANACRNDPDRRKGKKFLVNIEGTEYPWDKDTITTEEIAALGGWVPSLGVIEIDKHNNERTLQVGEVVELKPGQGFSKKIRWKRG